MDTLECVRRLEAGQTLTQQEFARLIAADSPALCDMLCTRARAVRQRVYGNSVFMRGLIEFTNFCKNDCYYCGIRRSNAQASRYRLDERSILECCAQGYALGFRTFVLQGGEDGTFTDARLSAIVRSIRAAYPDCAITLSVGERSFDSYAALYEAGADRYLLRHETADAGHYARLHPAELTLEHRIQCLRDLKAIGYQVGMGFMVGTPEQTPEHLAKDLCLIAEMRPQMVGIGPFIPHKDTPFGEQKGGSLQLTLSLLAIVRLLLPAVLLPATTALGTIHPRGRELGILAGANVVMPNLSPACVREKYMLYDNKIATGQEAAEGYEELSRSMQSIGYRLVVDRGDARGFAPKA